MDESTTWGSWIVICTCPSRCWIKMKAFWLQAQYVFHYTMFVIWRLLHLYLCPHIGWDEHPQTHIISLNLPLLALAWVYIHILSWTECWNSQRTSSVFQRKCDFKPFSDFSISCVFTPWGWLYLEKEKRLEITLDPWEHECYQFLFFSSCE